MDKHFIYSAAICLFAVFGSSACKKSDNGTSANPDSFKNTIWTGEFNYAGKAAEPVSIDFSEGGTLVWRELMGNHSGTWKLEGSQLSISLDGAASFKGNVSADNALTNLQSTDAGQRTLKNAALDQGAAPTLANTVWIAPDVTLKFRAGSVVDVFFGPPSPAIIPTYEGIPYTLNGKAVKFNLLPDYNWFGVIKGSSTMRGANHAPNDPTVYAFLATKQ